MANRPKYGSTKDFMASFADESAGKISPPISKQPSAPPQPHEGIPSTRSDSPLKNLADSRDLRSKERTSSPQRDDRPTRVPSTSAINTKTDHPRNDSPQRSYQLAGCKFCSKTVSEPEKIYAEGYMFHRLCFRCSTCKSVLVQDKWKSHLGRFYCLFHYSKVSLSNPTSASGPSSASSAASSSAKRPQRFSAMTLPAGITAESLGIAPPPGYTPPTQPQATYSPIQSGSNLAGAIHSSAAVSPSQPSNEEQKRVEASRQALSEEEETRLLAEAEHRALEEERAKREELRMMQLTRPRAPSVASSPTNSPSASQRVNRYDAWVEIMTQPKDPKTSSSPSSSAASPSVPPLSTMIPVSDSAKLLMTDLQRTQQLKKERIAPTATPSSTVPSATPQPPSLPTTDAARKSLLNDIEKQQQQREQANRDLEQTIAKKLREAEQLKKQLADLRETTSPTISNSTSSSAVAFSSPKVSSIDTSITPAASANIIAAKPSNENGFMTPQSGPGSLIVPLRKPEEVPSSILRTAFTPEQQVTTSPEKEPKAIYTQSRVSVIVSAEHTSPPTNTTGATDASPAATPSAVAATASLSRTPPKQQSQPELPLSLPASPAVVAPSSSSSPTDEMSPRLRSPRRASMSSLSSSAGSVPLKSPRHPQRAELFAALRSGVAPAPSKPPESPPPVVKLSPRNGVAPQDPNPAVTPPTGASPRTPVIGSGVDVSTPDSPHSDWESPAHMRKLPPSNAQSSPSNTQSAPLSHSADRGIVGGSVIVRPTYMAATVPTSSSLPERSRSVERQRKVDSSGEKEKEKKEKDEKKEKKEKKHQKTPSISSTEDLSASKKRSHRRSVSITMDPHTGQLSMPSSPLAISSSSEARQSSLQVSSSPLANHAKHHGSHHSRQTSSEVTRKARDASPNALPKSGSAPIEHPATHSVSDSSLLKVSHHHTRSGSISSSGSSQLSKDRREKKEKRTKHTSSGAVLSSSTTLSHVFAAHPKGIKLLVRVQSLWRGRRARRRYRRLLTKKKVVEEMWNTEKVYIEKLGIVCELIMKPLMKAASSSHPILSADQVAKWTSDSTIGDTFLATSEFVSVYETFMAAKALSAACLSSLRKTSPEFCAFIKTRENPSSLESMLILPVQRITRYHLLLQEALKNTDRSSPDHAFLIRAVERMKNICKNLDESRSDSIDEKRRVESLVALSTRFEVGELTTQNKLAEMWSVPHRVLLREGDCLRWEAASSQFIERHFVLLTDLLLIVKLNDKKKFVLSGAHSLVGLNLTPLSEPQAALVKSKGKLPSLGFELISLSGLSIELLLGRSEEEKDSIRKDIEQAVLRQSVAWTITSQNSASEWF